MIQLLQLLQPPESCCFPLCFVRLDGKITTENLKTLKKKIQFVEGVSLMRRPILRSCASLSISASRAKTRTNDKQPSQSLIDDSPLRLFPLLKADKPKILVAVCVSAHPMLSDVQVQEPLVVVKKHGRV